MCRETEVRELEAKYKEAISDMVKIKRRCDMGTFDEWSLKALSGIAKEAIEKATKKSWKELTE